MRYPANKPVTNQTPVRLVLKLLIIFILLLIIFQIVKEIRSSKMLFSADRTTIVINADPIVVLSFQKEEPTIIVTIPPSLFVPVPYGYGLYKAEAVWRLSQLESKPSLFQDTISDLLAIPISGWIAPEDVPILAYEKSDTLTQLKKNFSPMKFYSFSGLSNLNRLDRLLIGFKMLSLKANNTLIYETHKNEYIFTSTKLPDNTDVKVINEGALDTFLEQKFENNDIRTKGVLVSIYNTTNTSEVGQRFARFVSNFGGKVISVANDYKPNKKCIILVKSDYQYSPLTKLLQINFGCEIEIDEITQADIVVYVGDLFADRWK